MGEDGEREGSGWEEKEEVEKGDERGGGEGGQRRGADGERELPPSRERISPHFLNRNNSVGNDQATMRRAYSSPPGSLAWHYWGTDISLRHHRLSFRFLALHA